jgi:MFS family permease
MGGTAGNPLDDRLETLYDLVAEDEDARLCADLDDGACDWVPRNFFVLLASNTLTKLGDALANPKTVLAWVMAAVGAPTALIAWLVPLRESGSMVPQLLLGAVVRRQPRRRPLWLLGAVGQALAVAGCAAAAAWLQGVAAGAVILGCVAVFSLARSLNSLTSKDLLGKTIPRGRRGRLGGYAASISGVLTLAVGAWLAAGDPGGGSRTFYAWLLVAAASTWLVALATMLALHEVAGHTGGGRGGWREVVSQLALLRDDAPLRRFVTTRALLLCSALTAPFYVVLARDRGDGGASLLGSFLIAGGLASSLAAPAWGRLADRSSRRVMIAAALLTASLGVGVFAVVRWWDGLAAAPGFFPVMFFLLGIAHSGVRAGRKTYLVDLAGGDRRTSYVAVSNSLIGVILLLVGGLTSVLSFLAPEVLVLGLSMMGLLGALLATTLPEVEG